MFQGKAAEDLEAKLAPWKELKRQLTAARRTLKDLGKALLKRLDAARDALSPEECRDLVLALARDALEVILRKYIDEHLQEIIKVLVNLWDKYAADMTSMESRRTETERQFSQNLWRLYHSKAT